MFCREMSCQNTFKSLTVCLEGCWRYFFRLQLRGFLVQLCWTIVSSVKSLLFYLERWIRCFCLTAAAPKMTCCKGIVWHHRKIHSAAMSEFNISSIWTNSQESVSLVKHDDWKWGNRSAKVLSSLQNFRLEGNSLTSCKTITHFKQIM